MGRYDAEQWNGSGGGSETDLSSSNPFGGGSLFEGASLDSGASVTYTADGGASLEIGSSDFLTHANWHRDGQDLVLNGSDGESAVVQEYFAHEMPPVLTSPEGGALTPELVQSFMKSGGALQYAQSGGLANDASPIGFIKTMTGEASVTRTDGSEESLQLNAPVYEGDIVETSAEGGVKIEFADKTTFAVSNDARLAIDEYVYDQGGADSDTSFSMLRGVFVYSSGMIGKTDPSDVEINTPVGSIGIRGTIIAGDIKEGGEASDITLVDGAIYVKNFGGQADLTGTFETVRVANANDAPVNLGNMGLDSVKASYGMVRDLSPELFEGAEAKALEQAGEQDNTRGSDARDNQAAPQADDQSEGQGDNQGGEQAKAEPEPGAEGEAEPKPGAKVKAKLRTKKRPIYVQKRNPRRRSLLNLNRNGPVLKKPLNRKKVEFCRKARMIRPSRTRFLPKVRILGAMPLGRLRMMRKRKLPGKTYPSRNQNPALKDEWPTGKLPIPTRRKL